MICLAVPGFNEEPIVRRLHREIVAAMAPPARWGWFRPPAGVSLLAVLRKPAVPVGTAGDHGAKKLVGC